MGTDLSTLGGPGGIEVATILEHEFELNADRHVATDDEQLPAGELASVKGTGRPGETFASSTELRLT
jgi:hypothetical protein